ncbi:MAG TPA: NAD(P)-binding domain-containing protein [Lapillicoccus sp.]|nr:NAD(P)-binding domain-containing protein [Lapillicoccus sp.]
MRTSDNDHIETVIVGAGQAGLATGYHLQRAGRPFVILDGASRVGDGWRHQWDSLRLFTPAQFDGLPGMPFPGPRWSFPTKDEFADYLESYAVRHRLPVRLSTTVERVTPTEEGFLVTAGGQDIRADNVVCCTGTFGRKASVPGFADRLDPAIRQLHSSDYRRPSELPDGAVLVVGAAHSGCDIAYELAATHHTVLCGPDTGQIPVRFDSPLLKVVLPTMFFAFRHVLKRTNPLGRRVAGVHVRHGGPRLRVQQRDLAARGVDWVVGRVVGVRDGKPLLDDGRVLDVGTVVWCTGFRQAFDWVEAPAFAVDGWPLEQRGVADGVAGLFFCGLQFQYAGSSMLILGAGRDAAYVADRIVERRTAAARMAADRTAAA